VGIKEKIKAISESQFSTTFMFLALSPLAFLIVVVSGFLGLYEGDAILLGTYAAITTLALALLFFVQDIYLNCPPRIARFGELIITPFIMLLGVLIEIYEVIIRALKKLFATCLGITSAGFFLGIPVLILYQVYLYLRYGQWQSYSAIDGLIYVSPAWGRRPDDWVGVWEMLSSTPLSLAFLILAFLFGLLTIYVSDTID